MFKWKFLKKYVFWLEKNLRTFIFCASTISRSYFAALPMHFVLNRHHPLLCILMRMINLLKIRYLPLIHYKNILKTFYIYQKIVTKVFYYVSKKDIDWEFFSLLFVVWVCVEIKKTIISKTLFFLLVKHHYQLHTDRFRLHTIFSATNSRVNMYTHIMNAFAYNFIENFAIDLW